MNRHQWLFWTAHRLKIWTDVQVSGEWDELRARRYFLLGAWAN